MRNGWESLILTITSVFVLGALSVASQAEESIVFPKDFWWGTSLAAHQSEGGNHNSWTRWEETPGHIKNGDKSGLADDHWNRFEEDFDNLVALHANTHRMSIEWARLQPDGPESWNEEAALHYRKMIQALKARGIRPVICLFHFTLPIWFEDLGGFENAANIKFFVDFVSRASQAFGDLTNEWLTMNEPNVYAVGAYASGLTPPGIKDMPRALHVMANLMRAHGLAFHALKAQNAESNISFAQHLRGFSPQQWFNPFDRYGAKVVSEAFNWSWYQAITDGRIEIHVPSVFDFSEECPECLGSMDYLGFNYYSRDFVSVNLFKDPKFEIVPSTITPQTDLNWEIFPEGLVEILHNIKKRGLQNYPLIMTENGLADRDDKQRAQFIHDHLKVFLKISEELGLNAAGYLHWSLIDNFEWVEGFGPRFGLYEVDYKTQKRTARPSAAYFSEMGRLKRLLPIP